MKNLFKKQNTELDFGSLSTILSSGAAAGMAIANYAGKNPKTGGMIGAGLSLLIGGLLVAMEEDQTSNKFSNNQ